MKMCKKCISLGRSKYIFQGFPIRMAKRTCIRIFIIILFCSPIFFFIYHSWIETDFFQDEFIASVQVGCRHPELDLWNSKIRTYFKPTSPISCDQSQEWLCMNKGEVKLCNWVSQIHKTPHCTLTFLERVSDQSSPIDAIQVELTSNQTIKLTSDFFRASCIDKNDDIIKWSNIYAGIRTAATIHQRASWKLLPKDAMNLNVLIWGFDSLSRLTFMRKLPKTYKYLTEKLNGLVLKSYNIIGDGTPQALIPILTGKTELELPETRKRMSFFANYVNVYPFVWNDYRDIGYVTAFAEDSTSTGAFSYRLKGFDQEPTDHYMRTFYQAAEKEYYQHPPLCLRSTPRHKVLMNWVKQFFGVYRDVPKFLFTFHNELTHDDYNKVGEADDDLKEMLQFLKDSNYLNDTLLIIMSDHGHRFASYRDTQQGKQEERLPFFSFTFPPWFGTKFPEAYRNFQINTKRLSTPFDIYSTLKDVLSFTGAKIGDLHNRSISLFNEIPVNRTCDDARIEPHWCACLEMAKLALNDTIAVSAAEEVVMFINNVTEPSRDTCRVLQLKYLINAEMYIPTRGLLKFKQNADHDGFQPNMLGRTMISVKMYQVKLVTDPGEGHFEATVRYDVKLRKFDIKESDISRTNQYGSASSCIIDTQHHLRPYCYCKQQSSRF